MTRPSPPLTVRLMVRGTDRRSPAIIRALRTRGDIDPIFPQDLFPGGDRYNDLKQKFGMQFPGLLFECGAFAYGSACLRPSLLHADRPVWHLSSVLLF